MAEPRLKREIVDFDDHAVDFVVEGRALTLPAFDEIEHAVDRVHPFDMGVRRKAERAQQREELELGARRTFRHEVAHRIGKEGERTLGRQFRVELPDAAGSCVARVGERRLARRFARRVEPLEIRFADVRFAANVDVRGERAAGVAQGQRNRTDGAEIGGNRLAHRAVAARAAFA